MPCRSDRAGHAAQRTVSRIRGTQERALTPFQSGNRLYARKKYGEAIAEFVRHAQEFPEEAAKALASAGKCCKHVNTLVEPVQIAQGATLGHQGDRARAEHYYRAALEADSNHFAALRGLAQVLPEKSRERLELLERAAAVPPDGIVLIDLGDYYRSVLKDNERAYATYRRAQEVQPRDQTAYIRLNEVCRRMGRNDEAKDWSSRWREVNKTRRNVGHV